MKDKKTNSFWSDLSGFQRTIAICGFVVFFFLVSIASFYSEEKPVETPKPVITTVQRVGQASESRTFVVPTPTPYTWSMEATPRSSCFSEIGYDATNEVLHVVFRETGIEYVYYDFTKSDWITFYNADSLGKHFNAYIKGYYNYKKIG